MSGHLDSKQRRNLFSPGKSGNPAGRPRGNAKIYSDDLLASLERKFEADGIEAIETVARHRPDVYLKIIASLVPKEMLQGEDIDGDLAEIIETLRAVRARIANNNDAAADEPERSF